MSSVKVDHRQVCCNGNEEDDCSSAHPIIYLDMGEEENIACPYCGKVFIYDCTVELINEEKQ